ncbi:MAG: cadherin repeat domain-containing protein, partial [Chloroflexi bacterium]|nr:cadherin repeat domain-containing protein [Chloroflexota bacterium]
ITSSPQSGDTYRQGEAITITLTFNEPVTATGKPRLRLMIGETRRWAGYESTSEDGATLSFSHAVKADDQDADGIGIGKNQLKLNKGTISDADGNPANLKHPALPDQAGHKVNGAPDEPEQPEPEPTPTPTPEPEQPANNAPQFPADTATRSVEENSPAGARVGARVTAEDTDGDELTYRLTGSDAFTINGSGRIKVQGDLDYETQASYTVTVTAADPDGATDSIQVTISVVNVDEPGVVRLSSEAPQAGSALTATVTDPDGIVEGSVAWQWKRSPEGTTAADVDTTNFNDIAGATGSSIQLTDADDAGRWLRALAIYTDPFGAANGRGRRPPTRWRRTQSPGSRPTPSRSSLRTPRPAASTRTPQPGRASAPRWQPLTKMMTT